MFILRDGSSRYNLDDKPWLSFDESTGDCMKVLHVDRRMRQAVFVQRFGRNTTHPEHTHLGSAVAYTLSGTWRYDGEPFPEGAVAVEPRRSRHTPMTRDGEVAEVLVVLTADNEQGQLLELHMENGEAAYLDLDLMEAMAGMASQAEFTRFLTARADGAAQV
jgi:hypothetical protein